MKVLGNDPFKRGAASSAPEKTATEPAAKPPSDVEKLAEKIAAEPRAAKPVPPKPVMTPVKAEPKKAPVAKPGPPPPVPKMVMPKPKTGEGSPAKRAVTSFASTPPAPKVTAPERPSLKSQAVERRTQAEVASVAPPRKTPPASAAELPDAIPKPAKTPPASAAELPNAIPKPAKTPPASAAELPNAIPKPSKTPPARPSELPNAIPKPAKTPPARPSELPNAIPKPAKTPPASAAELPNAIPKPAKTPPASAAELPNAPAPKPAKTPPARPSELPNAPKPTFPDPDITAPSPPRTKPKTAMVSHYSPSAAERPPEPHADSPGFGPDPIAHSESPTLKHSPQAHEGSPGLIGPDPVAHAASPEGTLAPSPHEGSPELRAEFTPHEKSPEMVAEATPHADSPAVVHELKDAEPVPHVGSPEVMSQRVSALDAPETAPGLAGPLMAAATGLMNAAKSALGFGATGNLDTWGKDEGLTQSLHPVANFLYDKYFRVTVEGAELIPSGPSIIVANHSGALPLDGPMLHFALQRERPDLLQARWLVEDQVFHAPVLGVLINRLGAVRAHPENAVRLLQEGRPVIVFPEGFLGISKPFTQRYQLKRFGRGGYVKLALKHEVPIVPVAIVGAEESMPLIAKIPAGALGLPYLPLTPPPLPARWRIRFSDPIEVDGSTEDLAYVQEQNDLVRDTISGMLASMLGS